MDDRQPVPESLAFAVVEGPDLAGRPDLEVVVAEAIVIEGQPQPQPIVAQTAEAGGVAEVDLAVEALSFQIRLCPASSRRTMLRSNSR